MCSQPAYPDQPTLGIYWVAKDPTLVYADNENW